MATPPGKLTLAQILEQANERILKLEKDVRGVTPVTADSRALRKYLKSSRQWIDVRTTQLVELKGIKLNPRLSQEFGSKLVELNAVHGFDATYKIVGGLLTSTHEVIVRKYAEAGRTLSVLPGRSDVPYEPPPSPPLQPGVSMSGDSDVPVVSVLPGSTRSG